MHNKHTGVIGSIAAGAILSALGVHMSRKVAPMPDGFGWLMWPLVWAIMLVLVCSFR